MFDLKACTVCLQIDVKCYNMNANSGQLRKDYNVIAGLQTFSGNGLPEYLCYQCMAYVQSCKRFRDKCQRAYFVLQEILQRNTEITKSIIEEIDCIALKIAPNLTFLDRQSVKTKYDSVKFKWIKTIRMSIEPQEDIPVIQYGPQSDQISFEQATQKILETNIKNEDCIDITNEDCNTELDTTVNENVFEQATQKVLETDIKNEDCIDITNEDCNTELDITANANVFDTNFECQNDNDYDVDIDIDTNEIEPKVNNDVDASYCNTELDTTVNEDILDTNFECQNDNDYDVDIDIDTNEIEPKVNNDVDGSSLNEEYATMVPISINEAKAAIEIYKLGTTGKYQCTVCDRTYSNAGRLKVHTRMHEKHISGTHLCVLCKYYYKTEFLLKTHMTDKHMYKYLCRKCPNVSFDRVTAKKHYMWTHIQMTKPDNSVRIRPKWLRSKKVKKDKTYSQPVKKSTKVPKDFLTYSPISQEEQYAIVRERQNSRNYTESQFRCQHCFKGFREAVTYTKHLQKHDPAVSGNLQCDMCKIYCANARKMYKHMNITHLFKYTCEPCNFVCYNKSQALMHYRWHKNVTYPCPHCDKVFSKISTRLTHIRVKHPSMYICNLCGHSFVSENGLYFHKQRTHSQQEVDDEPGAVDTCDPLYCAECGIQFRDDAAFATHLGSSYKHAKTNLSMKPVRTSKRKPGARPRRDNSDIVNNGVTTSTNCEICQKFLPTDAAATRHYNSEHPGADYLKRYMCDICGHTTRQYASLMVHMRTHTQEKPYACPHCERRFTMPSSRDRHLVVHTGEKRYQCQHCNRRFAQSNTVKLHIQTVHLKIPYPPWDKKNRKRRRETKVVPLPPRAPVSTTHTLRTVKDADNYLSAYISYNE